VTLTVKDGTPTLGSSALALTGGEFQLQLQGIAGEMYRIEATRDFVTWTPLSTFAIPGGGVANFSDDDAGNHTHRFYRAIFLP